MKPIVVLMFIAGCGVYLLKTERESDCVAYGKEFGVEAHSISLVHKRCAADHWPANRVQPTESQAHA